MGIVCPRGGGVTEELLALAASGGSALVGAVASDAWRVAKLGVGRLFGRGDADRVAAAEARLERTKAEIEAAGKDAEGVRQRQEVVWTARLSDLLDDHP